MKKSLIWTTVGISLIIIFAFIFTFSITGGVIKLNKNIYGKYTVYTTNETYNKNEIDSKLNEIVLDSYGNANIYSKDEIDSKIEELGLNFFQNVRCSVYSEKMIDESKTGYENCAEKGHAGLCLIQRITNQSVQPDYSACRFSDFSDKIITQTEILDCNEKPERGDFKSCKELPYSRSDGLRYMEIHYRDKIICCD